VIYAVHGTKIDTAQYIFEVPIFFAISILSHSSEKGGFEIVDGGNDQVHEPHLFYILLFLFDRDFLVK